jgi:serine/threonine protein kinase
MPKARTEGRERFEIGRQIGAGGMGIVYEAFDHDRRMAVALKTIPRVDGNALIRLKSEFRALADVTHPNLVTLYDLVSDAQGTFFTMELISGIDFLRHVRFGSHNTFADTVESVASGPQPIGSTLALEHAADDRESGFDIDRLRRAMGQLASGVAALHASGKLHRDLKPSNVLVTTEGRVVILDFGLVIERHRRKAADGQVAGTAEYMAPEQATGEDELTEAADWYAVGIILYEALTGRLPYSGTYMRLLVDKQTVDAAPPSAHAEVPPDLDALCVALLRRRPEQRPRGAEVLAAFPAESKERVRTAPPSAPFVGRARELAQLRDAFQRSIEGESVALHVHGPSGMGKSALLSTFLDGLARGDATVLRGRCFDRESIPYKALDGIVDALGQHLGQQSQAALRELLPDDMRPLSRVFPVLRDLVGRDRLDPAVIENEPLDLRQLRARAFEALRELFARMAARGPLVVWIDDLQWGDADSAALLTVLTNPPKAPPLLLLLSYRSEALESAPWLRTLAKRAQSFALPQLDPAETRDLSRALLGGIDGGDDEWAHIIVDEAGGLPFFVNALARHVRSGAVLRRSSTGARLRLEDVVHAQIESLSASASSTLEVIAVAGGPVPRDVVARASALTGRDEALAVQTLASMHFVRVATDRSGETLETSHDRIRETVADALADARRVEIHRALADGLLERGDAEPERLAHHFLGAGERARAGEYFLESARRSDEALAFDVAAAAYGRALDLLPLDESAAAEVRRALAAALANAGRGAEAAAHYLEAARTAAREESIDLRRVAAEQLLRSGRIDEGMNVVRDVLRALNLRFPERSWVALLLLLFGHLRLVLRGLGYRARAEADLPRSQLIRIDACWSISLGLSTVDTVRGMVFQKRMVLLALQAGEPFRVARALAAEIMASAVEGQPVAKRTAALADKARVVVEGITHPYPRALMAMTTGVAAFLEQRFQDASKLSEEAVVALRDRCTGVAWELDNARLFAAWSLWELGRIRELVARVPLLVREAEERGDLYLLTNLRLGTLNSVALFRDDPETARANAIAGMAGWSQRTIMVQHYFEVLTHVQIDLYTGDADAALARIDAAWRGLDGAFLFRIQHLRVGALHLRAFARLAVATGGPDADRESMLRSAERDVAKVERERMASYDALSLAIRGAIAAARGDRADALRCLEGAARGLEAEGLALWAAVVRRHHGVLVGGEEGASLVRDADDFMIGQSIVRPDRIAAMMLPGFPSARG